MSTILRSNTRSLVQLLNTRFRRVNIFRASIRTFPMAVDHSSPPLQVGDPYRQLRVMAICGFVPALSLLLPCGILTAKVLPALGIAPMFFSAAFQLATIGARPRFPKATVCINLFLATFLFSVLLPRFVKCPSFHATKVANKLSPVGYSWADATSKTGGVPTTPCWAPTEPCL